MEGLLEVINMLGLTILQLKQQITQQQQAIETLTQRATKPAEPIDAKQSIKEPESPSSP